MKQYAPRAPLLPAHKPHSIHREQLTLKHHARDAKYNTLIINAKMRMLHGRKTKDRRQETGGHRKRPHPFCQIDFGWRGRQAGWVGEPQPLWVYRMFPQPFSVYEMSRKMSKNV